MKCRNCNKVFKPLNDIKIFCVDCIIENFNNKHELLIFDSYEKLWKEMVDYTRIFSRMYDLVLYPIEEIPDIFHDYSGSNKLNVTYGEMNFSDWSITIYINRAKSIDHLINTIIHEFTHAIVTVAFNVPLSEFDGHTKIFWKFMFDFMNAHSYKIVM